MNLFENLLALFADNSEAFAASIFDTAAKGTVVLLAAALAAWACRWASAAARRQMWAVAMTLLLVLPICSALFPTWFALRQPWPQVMAGETPIHSAILPAGSASGQYRHAYLSKSEHAPSSHGAAPAEHVVTDLLPMLNQPPDTAVVPPWIVPDGLVLSLVWLAGAALALLPLLLAAVSLRRLRQASHATSHPLVVAMFDMLTRQLHLDQPRCLGLVRPPRLLSSDERSVPMTWGMTRPVVLLPAEASTWSDPLLRSVLLHELGHVARHDCVACTLGQLARAIHWFNPLAWWSLSRLRVEQEQACDDLVLRFGVPPADYAANLVSVLAGLTNSRWSAGMALALNQAWRLQKRVEVILNETRSIAGLAPMARRGVWCAAVAICVTLAGVEWQGQNAALPVRGNSVVRSPRALPTGTLQVAANPLAGDRIDGGFPGAQHDTAVAINDEARPEPAGADQPRQPAAENPPNKEAPADADRDRADMPTGLQQIKELIEELALSPADARKLEAAAIKGMLSELNDPYAEYLPAEELTRFERGMTSRFVGIGVLLEPKGDAIEIIAPLADSPAEKAGILPGDVLLAIDGQPVAGREFAVVARSIAGESGTKVALKVRRADGQEREFEIQRGTVKVPSVEGLRREADGGWQYTFDEPADIGYARIHTFTPDTAADLESALEKMHVAGARGLLLDLRGCPGGMLPSVIDSLGVFLPKGPAVRLIQRGHDPKTLETENEQAACDLPMLVLIDASTASAAEVASAALRDRQRADFLGTRTFGKGSVQSIVPLGGGAPAAGAKSRPTGAIRLSTARFTSPDGREIQRLPNAAEWGVDPSPGLRLPVPAEEFAQAFQQWRQVRQVRPTAEEQQARAPLNEATVEKSFQDRQLAAALRAMQGRLANGQYPEVGVDEATWKQHLEARAAATP
jgi:carboxyl-terminal processing protease